jgi:hypothetical protein
VGLEPTPTEVIFLHVTVLKTILTEYMILKLHINSDYEHFILSSTYLADVWVASGPNSYYSSEFLATDPEVRVRFPALPDFLRNGGSGTGFTQSREYK